MRFGFVTCVQLGLACMEEIYAGGGKLDFVMTLHDNKARTKSGRVYLDGFCERHGIPLAKIGNINDAEAVGAIRAADLDWLFIVGWSQIARLPVLEVSRHGSLGMHPTLLPEGRGRAAIPWAILKGLSRTGVTLFKLDEGVDTGPILAQEAIPISPDESATSLYDRVNEAHRTLIRHIWTDLVSGTLRGVPQNPEAGTYWPGRTPEDGRLLSGMKLAEAERLVRAVTHPYPGAFMDLEGRRLRVWAGSTTRGTGIALSFEDGTYWADETEWESIPPL